MPANPEFNSGAVFNGPLSCTQVFMSTPSIGDAEMKSTDPVDTDKVRHRYRYLVMPNQLSTADAAAAIVPVHQVVGATATVHIAKVGSVTIATSTANAVCDLLKNGSSALTGTNTLDNANTNYVGESMSLTSSNLVAGDTIEAKITSASAGGGAKPKGVFFLIEIDEDPA